MNGQGASEAVTNARSALNINAASTWCNVIIDYDKKKLSNAYSSLLYFKFTAKYTVNSEGVIKVTLDGMVKRTCIWLPRLEFEFKIEYESVN